MYRTSSQGSSCEKMTCPFLNFAILRAFPADERNARISKGTCFSRNYQPWQKTTRNKYPSIFGHFFRPPERREVSRSSKRGRSFFRRMILVTTFYTFNQEMPSLAL